MTQPFSMQGKIVAITGASRGIGRGLAAWFADQGAHVILRGAPGGLPEILAGALDQPGFADGADARFHSPSWLALRNGTLFVADLDNRAIRAVNLATGWVTTLAGDPTARDSQDGTGASAQAAAAAEYPCVQ